MFEGLHPVERSPPLLRRAVVETPQTIYELLLPLGRKLSEVGIVPQSSLLFLRRLVLMLAQPLSAMRPRPLQALTVSPAILTVVVLSLRESAWSTSNHQ